MSKKMIKQKKQDKPTSAPAQRPYKAGDVAVKVGLDEDGQEVVSVERITGWLPDDLTAKDGYFPEPETKQIAFFLKADAEVIAEAIAGLLGKPYQEAQYTPLETAEYLEYVERLRRSQTKPQPAQVMVATGGTSDEQYKKAVALLEAQGKLQ